MSTFNFSPPYYLVGQSGKTLGVTPVSFEVAGVEHPRMVFRNQAADELKFFIRTDSPPDWMQEVSLLDSTSTRIFKGSVSAVDPTWDGAALNGWNVTVSGPWWWLEQAQITLLTCQENSGWHYTAPPASATVVPTPIIDSSNPSAVTIFIPTSPFTNASPILSRANCSLRYTTNGVNPTTSSPIYSGPIAAAAGMTIKAMGTKSGYTSSAIASASFTNRPTFGVPSQELSASFNSVMARMIALGVPMTYGTLSSSFPFLQLAWQGSTGADMLRDLLDAIPDAMTYFLYSGTTPVLYIVRRGDAGTTTLALGTDNDLTGTPINLKARRELRPSYVSVQGTVLNSNGEVTLTEQTAGDGLGASGVLGTQYVSVAGPGNRSYNNQAVALEKVALQTISISYVLACLYQFEPTLAQIVTNYGDLPYNPMSSNASWSSNYTHDGFTINSYSMLFAASNDNIVLSNGANVAGTGLPAGWHAVMTSKGDGIPSWWEETGYQRAHFKITSRCVAFFATATPEFFTCADMANLRIDVQGGTYLYSDFTIEFDAVNLDCTTRTAVVRPCDKFLVTPVTNLAQNLFNAQAFTSYDGTVPLLPGSVIPTPGNCVNITGGLAAWETMKSMVSSADINLEDGSATITLGFQPRMNANALLDKFQRATSGRIINL